MSDNGSESKKYKYLVTMRWYVETDEELVAGATETDEKLLEDKKIKVSVIKPNDNNLFKKTKKADILITAVGKPFFIKKEIKKVLNIIIIMVPKYYKFKLLIIKLI